MQNFAIIERGADVDGGRGVAGQVVCSRIVKAEIAGGVQHRCWWGQRGDSVGYYKIFDGLITQVACNVAHDDGKAVHGVCQRGRGKRPGGAGYNGDTNFSAGVVDHHFVTGCRRERGIDRARKYQRCFIGRAAIGYVAGNWQCGVLRTSDGCAGHRRCCVQCEREAGVFGIAGAVGVGHQHGVAAVCGRGGVSGRGGAAIDFEAARDVGRKAAQAQGGIAGDQVAAGAGVAAQGHRGLGNGGVQCEAQ